MFRVKEEYTTKSVEETEGVGQKIADALLADGKKRVFAALYGDMGAGKTAFVRGFVSRVCPSAAVRSPTYTIVNEYRGGVVPVFHFDMYRICTEDDLYSTGFWDYLLQDCICLCEWSENIPYALPEHFLKIKIAKTDDDAVRVITVEDVVFDNELTR